MRNFYDMLSVGSDAPADEIKKAFRREIARYHPDNCETGDADRFRVAQYAVLHGVPPYGRVYGLQHGREPCGDMCAGRHNEDFLRSRWLRSRTEFSIPAGQPNTRRALVAVQGEHALLVAPSNSQKSTPMNKLITALVAGLFAASAYAQAPAPAAAKAKVKAEYQRDRCGQSVERSSTRRLISVKAGCDLT